MPNIRVLDKYTAELIAAGEVVERPASVAKELVENAIDAGASVITVEMRSGGVEYLRITDNGCGIAREDVPTAFLRHATSKVRTEADLSAIGTLGFRGEALASIAAVSRVELLTATADEPSGTRYCIEGGTGGEPEDAGCPIGTTLVVRDLFYNVPARLKFLKKDVSEGNAVAGVLDRLALSHPEVSFRLIRDGKDVLLTPGDGNLLSTIYAVFGKEFAEGLLPVDYTIGGLHAFGFVNKPECGRKNRAMQFFFINSRCVKTLTGQAALEQAFKGSLMTGKFPACVLHITMPPAVVDANVHPAKTEVRFINERPVFETIYYGTKNALETQNSPKRGSLPSAFTADVPETKAEQVTLREVAARPVKEEPTPVVPAPTPVAKTPQPIHRTTLFTETDAPFTILGDGTAPRRSYTSIDIEVQPEDIPAAPPAVSVVQEQPKEPSPIEEPKPEQPVAEPPSTDKPAPTAEDDLPVLYLGEAFRTYILAQMGDELYVIDKHAAHERLLYDRLRTEIRPASQQLLVPASVNLSREEYDVLLNHLDELETIGFETEDFGGTTLLVRAIPAMLTGQDPADILQEIAGGLLAGRREVTTDKLDWLYHSLACRAAVKGGNIDTPEGLRGLAERVLKNHDVRTCPHGRPVCFRLTRKDIEKQFGRIV